MDGGTASASVRQKPVAGSRRDGRGRRRTDRNAPALTGIVGWRARGLLPPGECARATRIESKERSAAPSFRGSQPDQIRIRHPLPNRRVDGGNRGGENPRGEARHREKIDRGTVAPERSDEPPAAGATGSAGQCRRPPLRPPTGTHAGDGARTSPGNPGRTKKD